MHEYLIKYMPHPYKHYIASCIKGLEHFLSVERTQNVKQRGGKNGVQLFTYVLEPVGRLCLRLCAAGIGRYTVHIRMGAQELIHRVRTHYRPRILARHIHAYFKCLFGRERVP